MLKAFAISIFCCLLCVGGNPKNIVAESFGDMVLVSSFAKAFAITADFAGTESSFKNPAGITNLIDTVYTSSFSSYHDNLYQGVNIGVGGMMNYNIHYSVNIPVRMVTGIPQTIENSSGIGQVVGEYTDTKAAAMLTVATKLFHDTLSLGATTTYHRHQILDSVGQGMGFDLGALFEYSRFKLGASVQQLGEKINWEEVSVQASPRVYNGGVALQLTETVTLLSDMTRLNGKYSQNYAAVVALSNSLSILGGIHHDDRYNLGVELKLNGVKIDYAYSTSDDLGMVHKVGLVIAK